MSRFTYCPELLERSARASDAVCREWRCDQTGICQKSLEHGAKGFKVDFKPEIIPPRRP
jgi:hypothetical protein